MEEHPPNGGEVAAAGTRHDRPMVVERRHERLTSLYGGRDTDGVC